MCDGNSEHDKGLRYDRRALLKLMAGASVFSGLVGCGATGETNAFGGGPGSSSGSNTVITSENGQCATIPQETEGPSPADGTNGPNTLTLSGIVRNDIRSSFGTLSGQAAGTPTLVQLKVVNVNNNCSPLAGYAVYLWHCNANGQYSIYEVTDQNYLRGVQETDATGTVTFQTIFPGCYAGRYPHMHFELFPSLTSATTGSNSIAISQLALPSATCSAVYGQTSLYPSSQSRFQTLSIATDNIFSDGADYQIPEVTGDVVNGYMLSLEVGLAV